MTALLVLHQRTIALMRLRREHVHKHGNLPYLSLLEARAIVTAAMAQAPYTPR